MGIVSHYHPDRFDRRAVNRRLGCAIAGKVGGMRVTVQIRIEEAASRSTIAQRASGLRPGVIPSADSSGEKPGTLMHLERMQRILRSWRLAAHRRLREADAPRHAIG